MVVNLCFPLWVRPSFQLLTMKYFTPYIFVLFCCTLVLVACQKDDEEEPCTETVWYADNDNDGFGDPNTSNSSCTQPPNFVDNARDIDDTDANLNPNTVKVWQGPTITFTKANNADWTLAENQDRITDKVWISRANKQGIFNLASETTYAKFYSPDDTEWSFGTTAAFSSLSFNNWEDLHGSNPSSLLNKDLVLHLLTDDIYIDLKFTSWTPRGGGGFSYERSTEL